jgi:hypothetical protein
LPIRIRLSKIKTFFFIKTMSLAYIYIENL